MRSKLLALTAAAALGVVTLSAGAASAQRWHHHGWRGGWGPGIAGFAAGAAIGSALAAPRYYDYDYDDGPAVVGVAPGPGGDVSYCMQRFKSYDPASGTYLGYDGMRHPCP